MSVPAGATFDRAEPAAARIAGLLRPEFNVTVIRPDPADPALAGKPCAVKGCDHPVRCRGLCRGHHKRWSSRGKPDLAGFIASAAPMRPGPPRANEIFDLSSLTDTCRVEIAFVLQCRHDERARAIRPAAVRPVVSLLAKAGARSALERSVGEWTSLLPSASRTTTASALGFLRYAWRHLEVVATGGGVEAEYQRDVWDARRLGVAVMVGHYRVSFERIPQTWLRQAFKTWAQARLVGGMSFGAIRRDVTALSWFASWLAGARPHAPGSSVITRATIEEYLAHLAARGPKPNTRLGYLTSLRGFMEMARRRRWLTLPADAAIYSDDLPHRPAGLPRWIPEEVMAQLESEAALARLPDATTRHLVIVIMETGLRAGDACRLGVDCLIADSVGWPCLRFMNTKVATEQFIPLTPGAAIRAQQALTRVPRIITRA